MMTIDNCCACMYYCAYLEIFLSLNICRNFEFCQNFIDENFSPRDDEGKKITIIVETNFSFSRGRHKSLDCVLLRSPITYCELHPTITPYFAPDLLHQICFSVQRRLWDVCAKGMKPGNHRPPLWNYLRHQPRKKKLFALSVAYTGRDKHT